MKPLLSILLVIIFSNISAQPTIEWQKSLGGLSSEQANSIEQTTDGGYIVAGWSKSNDGDVTGNHGDNDYWIVKLTSTGTIEWQKSLGGTNNDQAYFAQQTIDGGYIVAGYSRSNDGDVTGNHGNYDYWIVKLTSTGTIEWQKSLGGSDDEFGLSIQQTADGDYIVAGWSASNDGDVTGNHGGTSDFWVVKLTGTGTIVWQKSLGGNDGDIGLSIQQTTDGGYIVTGYSKSNNGDVTGNHGNYDYWIVKLTSTGTIGWQKSLGGTNNDFGLSIQQTIDGGYIVAGYSESNDGNVTGNHGNYDYWIVKLTNTGVIEWQKSLGGTSRDELYSIQQTTDEGYIIAGYSASNDGDVTGHHGTSTSDYWIVKLTSTGTIEWQKSLGGTSNDQAYSIQQTTDGGYIVAGYSASNDGDVTGHHGTFTSDYWIVKLSSPLGINVLNEPLSILLYPNPTTGMVNIDLEEIESNINLRLINAIGQVILTKNYTSTNHINFNIDAPKGLYFLQLEIADGKTQTLKVIKK